MCIRDREWAEKYVKDLIDDDYAVIYYEADSVEISNPDNSDGLKYVGVSDSITYGSKVSSLFNSKARIIVNEIIKHKWTYEEYLSLIHIWYVNIKNDNPR